MTTATAIRRFPGPLNASDHAGESAAGPDTSSSSTATLIREPLFAIAIGQGSAPDAEEVTNLALRLLDASAREDIASEPGVCAALLRSRSVVIAASAGAVFRARGHDVQCLADGEDHDACRTFPTRSGDLYALCSPGLLDAVSAPRIRSLLLSHGPPSVIARRLLAHANQSADASSAAVVIFRVRAGD